jgi:hypothetical protein
MDRISLSNSLRLIAIVVICAAALTCIFLESGVTFHSVMHFLVAPVAYSFFWIPVLFVAYWIGCGHLTWLSVLVFAVVETSAVLLVTFDAAMHLYILLYK